MTLEGYKKEVKKHFKDCSGLPESDIDAYINDKGITKLLEEWYDDYNSDIESLRASAMPAAVASCLDMMR